MNKLGNALIVAALTLTASAQMPIMKKPIRGLTSMGLTGFNSASNRPIVNNQAELFSHPGVYKGSTINVIWKDLEPRPGVYDFSSIELGLKALAKYNAAHPSTPAVAKLRVWSGTHVPAWLIPITGGPFLDDTKQGHLELAGYWTPVYRAHWKALQAALAAKYDADPLVGEVGSSSCSAATDESFILPKGAEVQKQMRAKGFTDAAERACLLGMVDDYDPWKLTPVDETFSPYINTDVQPHQRDDSFSLEVMKVWRAHFGERGVISNHSVQDPITENLKPIFCAVEICRPADRATDRVAGRNSARQGRERSGGRVARQETSSADGLEPRHPECDRHGRQ